MLEHPGFSFGICFGGIEDKLPHKGKRRAPGAPFRHPLRRPRRRRRSGFVSGAVNPPKGAFSPTEQTASE